MTESHTLTFFCPPNLFLFFYYQLFNRAIPEHLANFFFCLRTRKTFQPVQELFRLFLLPGLRRRSGRKQIRNFSARRFFYFSKKSSANFFVGSDTNKSKSVPASRAFGLHISFWQAMREMPHALICKHRQRVPFL